MTTPDARIERLERQVEMLLAKVETQAAEIVELKRRLGENSSNSSKPPSSDPPGTRADRPGPSPSGKRRGGQRGHKGHRRELLPLTQVTDRQDCFPSACRACEAPLPATRDDQPMVRQVVDLPELKPAVTQYDCHHVRCKCGVTTCGAPPAGTPTGLLGPGVLALAALLVAECHVSRRKVQSLLQHLLGIRVSLGALSESEEIVSDAVAAAVEQARLHALGERIKHVDATTWSCAGAHRCLWTCAEAQFDGVRLTAVPTAGGAQVSRDVPCADGIAELAVEGGEYTLTGDLLFGGQETVGELYDHVEQDITVPAAATSAPRSPSRPRRRPAASTSDGPARAPSTPCGSTSPVAIASPRSARQVSSRPTSCRSAPAAAGGTRSTASSRCSGPISRSTSRRSPRARGGPTPGPSRLSGIRPLAHPKGVARVLDRLPVSGYRTLCGARSPVRRFHHADAR